jgi:hypothetical protein
VALGDGVALFPGVTGSGDRWWSHISKASDDLSRLARDVFGQSLDLFSGDLGAGWGSSMTDRGRSLVDSLAELIENSRPVALVQSLLPGLQSLDLGLDVELMVSSHLRYSRKTRLLLHGWSDLTSGPLVCSCSQTGKTGSSSSSNSLTSVDEGSLSRR